jgi:hypothetical protein
MPGETEAQNASRMLSIRGASNPAAEGQHQEETYRAVYSTTVLVCSIETGESGKRLGMVSLEDAVVALRRWRVVRRWRQHTSKAQAPNSLPIYP